jgi:tRNA pseudouridine55 synthase
MSAPIQDEPEGILLVDKPSGLTSHDVVARLRRVLGMKRIGHAGTLDPMATGLLILLVGRATKVSQYMMSMDKEYGGAIRLGVVTDTQDAEGKVLEEHPLPAELDEEAVRACMAGFLGDQYQTPPMFSAKKVEGQKLYKLARKGKTVEREPRVIHVARFDLLAFEPPLVRFEVASSKGTYIRTLAHDMGERLGCGGHLCELRRTAIGRFHVDKALPLAEIEELSPTRLKRRLVPVRQAVPSYLL